MNRRQARNGRTLGIVNAHSISIHPVLGGASCSACAPGGDRGSCLTEGLPRCRNPRLSGPSAELQRLLAAVEADLAQHVTEAAGASGLVQALRLEAGEAELTLTVAPGCGGQLLADCAFQTLRRMLPDTDIYVACSGA